MTLDLAPIQDLIAARDIRRAESAIAKLLRADLSSADSAQVLALRARVRLLGARPEEAGDDIAAALRTTDDPALRLQLTELAGDAAFARFELAAVGFAERVHIQAADERYRELIAQVPSYPNLGWLHYQRGRICLIDGRADDAIAAFTQALLGQSTVRALTAYCFERLGFIHLYERRDLPRALGFLDKALYTYPAGEDPVWVARVETLRARALRETGRLEQALAAVENAIAISAQHDESRIAHADALLTAAELLAQIGGREREVIARIQQFLGLTRRPPGIDVTYSRAYEMLGTAYAAVQQYAAAAEAFQQALQYNPYHPWEVSLHYQIARALYASDDYDKAIHAVENLLSAAKREEQPVTDYRVYDVLGSAHFARQHYRAAREAFDQALTMAPASADVEKIRRYRQFAVELGG